MAFLSLVEIPGDTATLLAAYDALEERMADAGPMDALYLAHACARSDGGILLMSLWNSEADFQANWDHPDLEAVAAEVGMPPADTVRLHRYEVHKHHVDP